MTETEIRICNKHGETEFVKDSSGRHVFENSSEARTPAYMLFALPEDMHLLFRKASDNSLQAR